MGHNASGKSDFSLALLDVVLVFDFDPQDNRCDLDTLRRYQEVFCDSTDNGFLFVNYPSTEAYRDFEVLGDLGFVDERVPIIGDAGCASYKDLVSRRRNGRVQPREWRLEEGP